MPPSKCENCGVVLWSAKQEDFLCVRCQIGDQSPSLWLFQKIYDELKTLGPNKHHRTFYNKINSYVSLTYNAKTGECVGSEKPKTGTSRDFVTISTSVSCDNATDYSNLTVKFNRWLDAGSEAVSGLGPYEISNIENLVVEAAPLFVVAVSSLIDFIKEDMYFCVGCYTEKKNPPTDRHFAGLYCAPCWEQYKKKNSQVCLKCRRQYWQCYC